MRENVRGAHNFVNDGHLNSTAFFGQKFHAYLFVWFDLIKCSTLQTKTLSLSPPVVMIHWTRQIKAVLSAQSVSDMGDTSGPLEEISFWKSRCADLESISKQLQKPGVCHIQAILQLHTSNYIPSFCELAKQIQVQPST